MKLSIFTSSKGAEVVEEVTVIQFPSYVSRPQGCHSISISVNTVCIKDGGIHIFENPQILRFYRCIAQHCRDFIPRTFVVSLPISPIASGKRVSINEDWFVSSLCPWDSNDYDMTSVCFSDLNIFVGEDVDTDFFGVVYGVPELFYELFGIWEVDWTEGFIGIFFNTKKDDSAKCVGKCRICFPDAFRQSS